jgi:hypothetical protein
MHLSVGRHLEHAVAHQRVGPRGVYVLEVHDARLRSVAIGKEHQPLARHRQPLLAVYAVGPDVRRQMDDDLFAVLQQSVEACFEVGRK